MTRNLIFLALLSAVSAFNPSTLPGVSKPMGYFDPLGLARDKTEIGFNKIRESEIKHGRVAMLGSLGLLVEKYFHPLIPGNLGSPIYFWQIVENRYPLLIAMIVFGIGMTELYSIPKSWEQTSMNGIADLRADYVPGFLAWNIVTDEDELRDLQTKELNNGRLAMIASLMIVLQEYIQTTP
jgi:hypothetical protein